MPAARDALSHYRLLEPLGQGGMGVVYRAHDTRLDRPVAIKVLRPERAGDADQRRSFESEARTAASLNHPNICTVHEVGEAAADAPPSIPAGSPYIVMELIEGETLHDRLARTGPLPLPEVLDLAVQLAEGLSEAHRRGVVHRDLKPRNLVVTPSRRLKILDFGLARRRAPAGQDPAEADTLTLDGSPTAGVAGTLAYMAPEQTLGRAAGPASDRFSFGAVLYELASGTSPFQADTAAGTIARILEADPPPLGEARPDIPAGLEALVHRCLARQPQDRPSDTADLLRELQSIRGAPGAASAAHREVTVAVLPFLVRGGDAFGYLREGMVNLMSTKLDGAGDLRSVDANVILCCGGAAAEDLDPERGAELARRFSAGLFVLGSILEVGGRLHVEASLYDAATGGAPVARSAAEGDAGAIFGMVDRLAAELLAGRPGGPEARMTRLAATSTASFPALKAYLEGEREMRDMRRGAAVDAFRHAVTDDPGFALAWYRLAVAALWSQRPEEAWEAVERALEHVSRLNPRDRALLDAFHALLRGASREAEERYQILVGTHPDEAEAWFQLAELQFHHGPQRGRSLADSRTAWGRLLALDPGHLPALMHMAVIAGRDGHVDRLREATGTLRKLSPDGDASLWALALEGAAAGDAALAARARERLRDAGDHAVIWAIRILGVYHGDLAAGRDLCALLLEPSRSPAARAQGHLQLAFLDAAMGRPGEAARGIARARGLAPGDVLAYDALLRLAGPLPPGDAELATLQRELEEWNAGTSGAPASTPWLAPHDGLQHALRAYLLGLVAAARGDEGGAREAARALEQSTGPRSFGSLMPDLAAGVRAHVAAAAGRPGDALRLLEAARGETSFYLTLWSPFLSLSLERLRRAQWLHEEGRLEEALPWYGSFAENQVFDLLFLAPALEGEAAVLEELGRGDEAARALRRFADLWAACETGLRPRLRRASERLPDRSL